MENPEAADIRGIRWIHEIVEILKITTREPHCLRTRRMLNIAPFEDAAIAHELLYEGRIEIERT